MNQITIYDVWAEWCFPCKKFSPIFEKLANEYPEIKFVQIEADLNPEFLNTWKITSIPTIMFFKDENLVFSHTGILSEDSMRKLISTISAS